MFLSYYGLREQPFGVTPDPRFLYETAVHREALASLLYGIESGIGFTALLAPPGMGKTTLLYHLLERYRHTAQTAYIFETQCNSHEFLQALSSDLELDTGGSDAELRARLKKHLATQAMAGRRVLVLIDEAQNLDDQVLETVRLLSNFETPRQKLLHIILSGQPQLEARLAHPAMLQLRQRITLFTRLAPFGSDDSAAFIEHRLKVAGYHGRPLFTPNALAIISAESHGIPREINRLCFNALSLGFALQKRTIDAEVLYEVISDLRLGSEPMPPMAWQGLVNARSDASEEAESTPATQLAAKKTAVLCEAVVAAEALPEPGGPGVDAFAPPLRPLRTARIPESRDLRPTQHDVGTVPSAAQPFPTSSGRSAATVAQGLPVLKAVLSSPYEPEQPGSEAAPAPPAAIPESEVPEPVAADPDAAVQRALLNVAIKRHHKSSYAPLAGVALLIPLVLWIIAYLIFRFDLVGLLRR